MLTLDLRKVDVESIPAVMRVRHIARHRREFRNFTKKLVCLAQVFHAIDFDALNNRGLADISQGKNYRFTPPGTSFQRERKCPLDGAHFTGKSQFASNGASGETRQILLTIGGYHADSDWQVKTRALLPYVSRC